MILLHIVELELATYQLLDVAVHRVVHDRDLGSSHVEGCKKLVTGNVWEEAMECRA
jgi:hypothetical protein